MAGARALVEAGRPLGRAAVIDLWQAARKAIEAQGGEVIEVDFPLAHLTQAQLDTLKVPARDIEDIYPLSPMQQGLLVHTLLEPGSGIYYMQDRYIIDSEIDLPAFTQQGTQDPLLQIT